MGPGTSAYILPDGSGTGCTRGEGGGGRESVQLLTGEPVSPSVLFCFGQWIGNFYCVQVLDNLPRYDSLES